MIYMNFYKSTMKKVFYIMICLMLFSINAVKGQEQTDNEKLTAYKIAFFTQRLDLTPAEAEKFWPVYNDYSARKSKLQIDRISMIRYATQNEANMSEAELSETADKLARTFVDEASLVATFSNDLKKALPPAKVIRLFQIENQYKQQLLRELNQRRQEQNKK
jgi:hypothetical protein